MKRQRARRRLAVALSTLLLWTCLSSGAAAVTFLDVSPAAWYYVSIDDLADRELINGYSDNTYRPGNKITRAEFVKVLALLSGADVADLTTAAYSDVKTGDWFMPYVAWASQLAVVEGSAGRFYPDEPIVREEMATILARYVDKVAKTTLTLDKTVPPFSDRQTISSWALESVTMIQQAGIIQGYGDGTFLPRNSASRAEATELLSKFIKAMASDEFSEAMEAAAIDGRYVGGAVMVPARPALTKLGYAITYYNKTALVVADDGVGDLLFWDNKKTAYLNGRQLSLTVAPYNESSSLWLPLAVLEAAGADVVTRHVGGGDYRVFIAEKTVSNTTLNGLDRSGKAYYGVTTANAHTLYEGRTVSGNLAAGLADIANGSGHYHGILSQGSFQTSGHYVGSLGVRYYGEWSNGRMTGSGRLIYGNGEVFVGTFADGKFSSGSYYLVDGSVFEGRFNGSYLYPTGSGTYTTVDGKTYSGNWRDYGALKVQ